MTEKIIRVHQQTLTLPQLITLLDSLDHAVALASSATIADQVEDRPEHTTQPTIYSIYSGLPLRTTNKSADLSVGTSAPLESADHHDQLPFIKGWIGAQAYSDNLAFFGYYTWSYTYCHASKSGMFVFSDECSADLEQTVRTLANQAASLPDRVSCSSLCELDWRKSQSYESYARSFARLQDYILAGDCYQANLTQRFEADCALDKKQLLSIFFESQARSTANYCAFIELSSDNYLLSLSPEKFIDCDNRQITSKPIKGTVKSNGPIQPEERAMLLNSKNRAENLMIVDLLRNDMSKVSKLNSVRVPSLFAIESYENVHHLVSTIHAEMRDGISEYEAFCAAFPGGSITGAPKKRAMEIIEELEVHPRRYYCGSVFYWDFRGKFDSSILIRTAEKLGNRMYCWAGGGIVADSEVRSEYQESIDKVRHITGLEE